MYPTHAHNPSIFPLALICLCSNIRRVGVCGEGVFLLASPPYPPQVWTSANCRLHWHWTYPHAATLPSSSANRVCRSPQATWDIFRDDGRLWNKRGASWKKINIYKVPGEVKKHTVSRSFSVVKLLHSFSPGKHPEDRRRYSRSSQCRWRQNKVNNRGNKKEKPYSFMALSCVDLMFLSPCVYVCLSVCVHASATKKKNETAYEKKRKPGSSSCAC